MVFSSIGPWALGIIMNTLGNTSHWYKNAIYFYLHFQYNGWFIFCLLGTFLIFLEKNKINIDKKTISSFYNYLLISCFFTLFLSFLWMNPPKYIFVLATLGIVFQLIALVRFHQILIGIKSTIAKNLTPFLYQLFKFIYVLFITKILLQFLSDIPYFSTLISQIIDFVIGYLHLIFLGLVSLSLFLFLDYFRLIKLSQFWVKIYLIGFIISEVLIIYKGFCNWQQVSIFENYYLTLVLVSGLIPISVFGIFFQNISKNRNLIKK
jgi:hypothetical protein